VAAFLLAVATEERMARFLRSVGSEPIVADLRVRVAPVNGESGLLVVSGDKPISALVLDVSEGVVRTIHLVANPEKLAGVRGIETP
jgi:RNA polymerase sigma-70 factor (ECF subfamily)